MTRKDAGLTLIELLITLALAALMMTVGIPAFRSLMERIRFTSTIHLVSVDLAMARNSAIMRNSQVVVCPRTKDRECRDDGDWSQGWMVFSDSDGNRRPDEEFHILRVTDPPAHGSLAIISSRPLLRYQRDGRSAHSNQTVRVCSRGVLRGTVVINNGGRLRSSTALDQTPCAH